MGQVFAREKKFRLFCKCFTSIIKVSKLASLILEIARVFHSKFTDRFCNHYLCSNEAALAGELFRIRVLSDENAAVLEMENTTT